MAAAVSTGYCVCESLEKNGKDALLFKTKKCFAAEEYNDDLQ